MRAAARGRRESDRDRTDRLELREACEVTIGGGTCHAVFQGSVEHESLPGVSVTAAYYPASFPAPTLTYGRDARNNP